MGWTILRPTLIYGFGRDQNVSRIAGLFKRVGFFPLFGGGRGLRQPVHAEDVARACEQACHSDAATNHSYAISGGETLSYREMVARIALAMGMKPRLLSLPRFASVGALTVLKCLPRYRHLNMAMVDRMNDDLVFDDSEARRDFAYSPRRFRLEAGDLPGAR